MRARRLGAISAATYAAWWSWRNHSSPAAQSWWPTSIARRRAGRLSVRDGGAHDDTVVVLMHGLVATGDIFGGVFDQLAARNRMVVPDLLGFGRSVDESRQRFDPEDHLDALDEMLETLALSDRPLVIGAHSMGSALALLWAQRHPSRIQRVICWGAPIYADAHALNLQMMTGGPLLGMLVADNAAARAACRFNCRHRTLSGWIAAAARPELPVSVARAASLHTWPAYRDALGFVADSDWKSLIAETIAAGTAVELIWGEHDQIGDRCLATTFNPTSLEIVPGAAHHLPLTHGRLCVEQLTSVSTPDTASARP